MNIITYLLQERDMTLVMINPNFLPPEDDPVLDLTISEDMLSKEQQLERITYQINSLNNVINYGMSKENEIQNEIIAIQRQVRDKLKTLADEKNKIISTNYQKRKELNGLKKRLETIKREKEAEEAAKKLTERYKEQEARLDEIAKNYAWSKRILKHQLEGANFVTHGKRLILADVMGLGKTLTYISSLDLIQAATEFASPQEPYVTSVLDRFPVNSQCGLKVLVLSGSELTYGAWEEFKLWAPHRNIIFLTGFPKAVKRVVIDTLKNMKTPEYTVILNYESWKKDMNLLELLGELEFDTVIMDEAHRLKDRRSITYRGTASLLSQVPSCFRIFSTGTPILNKPQEFYSLLSLADPYRFYDENQFLNEFCTQKEDETGRLRWTFKAGGVESLYKKVGPIVLRRTKQSAGIILPEKSIINHNLEIDEETYPEQARARNEMRKWGSVMLDPKNSEKGFIAATVQIAVLTRLRQVETWPAGIALKDPLTKEVMIRLEIHESQKLDYILNPIAPFGLLTDALESEERVVVFSQFTEPLKELYKRCQNHKLKVAIFTGETSREDREILKRDFDAARTPTGGHKFDVLLCNYRTGGEGQNFTGASQMIILDEEWNPGKRDQAYDRLHRIGQQKPITIHVVRVTDTVDTWLAELIKFKEEMVTGFEKAISSNAAFEALKEGKI